MVFFNNLRYTVGKEVDDMLEGKRIILGITGGIAAYKSAILTSMLVKAGADVQVIMTEHAREFITPLTFEALTNQRCLTDTFDRNHEYSTEHVALAKEADAVIVAPATANVIAKLAHGLADDMLTTTFLACKCPKIIAPAMNTQMYENPITGENIELLRKHGVEVAEPVCGRLACGDTGAGKMREPEELFQYVLKACAFSRDMNGLRVMVTAGATRESIDPVRYITNHSTGKMGYSLARICALRGADVTLVTGKTALVPPLFTEVVPIMDAREMYEAVTARSNEMDIVIKSAAVADYRPKNVSDEKIKKSGGQMVLEMERTDDILGYLGQHKREGQYLCGFSMETENMLENSKAKLEKKHVDMIVANNLKVAGAGFGTDTNIVTLITRDEVTELEMLSKDEVAERILDAILEERKK